jgi:hypothetical protein
MKEKIRITFDFDGVLDIDEVHDFVRDLISRKLQGLEIWVVTTRNHRFCDEVKNVTDTIGIPSSRVIFTSGKEKYLAMRDINPILHLDDDWDTIKKINNNTDTLGLTNFGNPNWIEHIERELNKHYNI